jgi:hypothetical protein
MNDLQEICFPPVFNKSSGGGWALWHPSKQSLGLPGSTTKTHFNFEQILFMPLRENISQKLPERFFISFACMLASVRNVCHALSYNAPSPCNNVLLV